MNLKVKTNLNNYSVIIGKNLRSKINRIILKERIHSQKFLLVYDSKVPAKMIKSIFNRFNHLSRYLTVIDKQKLLRIYSFI